MRSASAVTAHGPHATSTPRSAPTTRSRVCPASHTATSSASASHPSPSLSLSAPANTGSHTATRSERDHQLGRRCSTACVRRRLWRITTSSAREPLPRAVATDPAVVAAIGAWMTAHGAKEKPAPEASEMLKQAIRDNVTSAFRALPPAADVAPTAAVVAARS